MMKHKVQRKLILSKYTYKGLVIEVKRMLRVYLKVKLAFVGVTGNILITLLLHIQ